MTIQGRKFFALRGSVRRLQDSGVLLLHAPAKQRSRARATILNPELRFPSQSTLSSRSPTIDVADDGLPTNIHVDMLDANKLMSAATQASENLYLQRIRSH